MILYIKGDKMLYILIGVILVALFFVWVRYNKIKSDLINSKKKLENCIERVDLIHTQIEFFRNAISEIDTKITKIEKGLYDDKL